jgi:hypothetical protein
MAVVTVFVSPAAGTPEDAMAAAAIVLTLFGASEQRGLTGEIK